MKKLFYWLLIPFFFSCVLISCKQKSEKVDPRFIGTWKLPVIDAETKDVLGQMKMTFTADGKIIYDMNETTSGKTVDSKPAEDDIEDYYISKGYLYTNKKGMNPDKAGYKFITDDELRLDFEGNPQMLTRIKDAEKK